MGRKLRLGRLGQKHLVKKPKVEKEGAASASDAARSRLSGSDELQPPAVDESVAEVLEQLLCAVTAHVLEEERVERLRLQLMLDRLEDAVEHHNKVEWATRQLYGYYPEIDECRRRLYREVRTRVDAMWYVHHPAIASEECLECGGYKMDPQCWHDYEECEECGRDKPCRRLSLWVSDCCECDATRQKVAGLLCA